MDQDSATRKFARLPSLVRNNLQACLRGFRSREHSHLAGHQEAEEVYSMLNPFDIRNDGEPLPPKQVNKTYLCVLQYGTRIDALEVSSGLIVDSNTGVLFECFLDGRF